MEGALIAKRLEGKVALITGGASGIGKTMARLFILHGAKVIIADIQDDLGHSVCHDISTSRTSHTISYVHCNITNESNVENVVKIVVSKHGKLDILFSNAGITNADEGILDFDCKKFSRVFNANVLGGFLAAKHVAKVMIPAKKKKRQHFVHGKHCISDSQKNPAHAASKHVLVGLTKNLCVELGEYGIRVNCVLSPGVATPLLRNVPGIHDKKTLEDKICSAANLKGVVFWTNDVAEAVMFLTSDESKYVSGLNLVLDRGHSTTYRAIKDGKENHCS